MQTHFNKLNQINLQFKSLVFITLLIVTHVIFAQNDTTAIVDTTVYIPDSLCSGFAFDNTKSVMKLLGNDAWEKAIVASTQFPRLVLRNTANNQQLELIQHYGNPDYSVSEFRVSYVSKSDTNSRYIKTKFNRFESGKKISLGLTSAQVQKIWGGTGVILRSNEKTIVQYRIKSGIYMQHHSKKMYYATYAFVNDKLVEFSYGFDYE